MKRRVTFCFIFCSLTILAHAQTRLRIIATVHNPTKYITQDSLIKVLEAFKPDIILMEWDTSLIDDKGNIKLTKQQMANSLEGQTAQFYIQQHPQTAIRGFDIDYRNKFYKEHNTFSNEIKMGNLIDSMYKKNLLNDTTWFIVNALYSANQILNNFSHMKLKDINSALCMQAASLRQTLLYKRETEIIHYNQYLKSWYSFAKENADFWELRNKIMTKNILKYIKMYPRKKIAVMVGFYHKYALIDYLKPLSINKKFVLADYTDN
ncbi:hypothetical protein ACFQ3S_06425 [Mucilaginibacter terrae]|uniref:hypothetical protein n=1 Tax=Mucilaginibacter terrae TaxID=1955052 RepID=UPI003636E131